MASVAHLHPEPAPLLACTVSREVEHFDLLIEDMETALGEAWGDLGFEDAVVFLGQPEAQSLEFIALILDPEDLADGLTQIIAVAKAAREADVKVLLITDGIEDEALEHLAPIAADLQLAYPLGEGALAQAIEDIRAGTASAASVPVPRRPRRPAVPEVQAAPATSPEPKRTSRDRQGVVLPVHGLAGGVGSTTFAVNLAWELATLAKEGGPRVCLIDFDLQFGSVSTSLDLPRREAVFELLSDTASIDTDALLQSMTVYGDRLHVLTSPPEMLPLDFITSEDVNRILALARANFDFVIIDLPTTIVQLTEAILNQAQVYFSLIELDMRSAQNALRMVRALKAESLPHEKLRFLLNRAPGFTDLSGKSRAKRLADSLAISLEVYLPDGGKAVTNSSDQGQTLAETAPKNPLRKEIQKLAKQLSDLHRSADSGMK